MNLSLSVYIYIYIYIIHVYYVSYVYVARARMTHRTPHARLYACECTQFCVCRRARTYTCTHACTCCVSPMHISSAPGAYGASHRRTTNCRKKKMKKKKKKVSMHQLARGQAHVCARSFLPNSRGTRLETVSKREMDVQNQCHAIPCLFKRFRYFEQNSNLFELVLSKPVLYIAPMKTRGPCDAAPRPLAWGGWRRSSEPAAWPSDRCAQCLGVQGCGVSGCGASKY